MEGSASLDPVWFDALPSSVLNQKGIKMLESIIVALIVIAAGGYVIYNITRKFRGTSTGCGCSGCESTSCTGNTDPADCKDK